MVVCPNKYRTCFKVCLQDPEVVFDAPKLTQLPVNPLRIGVLYVRQQSTVAAPSSTFVIQLLVQSRAARIDSDKCLVAAAACSRNSGGALLHKRGCTIPLESELLEIVLIPALRERADADSLKIGFLD